MEKNYTFNGKEIAIDGTEALHELINSLITTVESTKAQLESAPNLEEQLKLWEKAKPYFKEHKLEVDYSKPPVEVMKLALGDKYPVDENTSEDTVKYLFTNVLPEIADVKEPNTTDKSKSDKPAVAGSKNTSGMSSTELSDAMLAKKMSGKVVEK